MRGEYARAVTEGCGPFALSGEMATAWDDRGVWRFEGVAATGLLDRQGERLTPAALGRMARQHLVELRSGHRAGKIGVVDECWVQGDEVWVRGRLEGQSAEAGRIYTRLKRGERLALSVGGKVTGARWTWDEGLGRAVRLIEDVELEHVAVCQPEAAVNPGTWVGLEGPALKYRSGGKRPSGTQANDADTGPLPSAALEGTAGGDEGEGGERRPTPSPSLQGGETEERRPTRGPSLQGQGTEGRRPAGDLCMRGGDSHRSEGEPVLPTPDPSPTPQTVGAEGEDETKPEAVKRGEPQGLSGQSARPVGAARFWEGVL